MGTIMIFLRMRRPGADGARREPARMGRRRASRRRVDVGRDVRRRDRAVRVVLDAMLAAQERARDLAINIVVEAALRRRRRRRGPVAARHVRRDLLQQTQAAVRERVEGPGPEEPRRLQFFRPLDSGGARRVVLAQRREDGGAGDGRARAHEAQIAARRARVRERARLHFTFGRALVQLDEEPHERFNGGRVEAPPEDAEQLELDESYVLAREDAFC